MAALTRQELGKSGEDLACDELLRRGYAILARRYRTRLGELDIVARDGETLVFVEVKARRGDRFGRPEDAVTWSKRRRLVMMAGAFVARAGLARVACRFDIVAVTCGSGPGRRIDVFQGAFRPGE
jgi:putative endonuclease